MELSASGTVLLAGAGKMGLAMLERWLELGLNPKRVIVQDPQLSAEAETLLRRFGVTSAASVEQIETPPDIIVVAVKPQVMAEVLPGLARLAGASTIVLSIAAGRSIAGIAAAFPAGTAVVRAMPNTPAAIGRGITAAIANAETKAAQRDLADALLSAVGEVVWLDNEADMDAVTAVSGSGPAYVFLLAECLAEAGRAAGLDAAVAAALARATVAGAGALLERSDEEPDQLRRNVTSPGGTTAAALSVLMAKPGGMAELLEAAVKAATARSRELAS